jgi:hypothetical protein
VNRGLKYLPDVRRAAAGRGDLQAGPLLPRRAPREPRAELPSRCAPREPLAERRRAAPREPLLPLRCLAVLLCRESPCAVLLAGRRFGRG